MGPPLVNEQLRVERLSKPLGLGVLSCDGISSANYGSELILHELLPFFGLAAFTLLLPMTGVILLGIALVVLSYREVVTVYTRTGGSYVVARENFGPRVAQVAVVALMVDYVVTVAVQTAAGSAAILSTFPALARPLGETTTATRAWTRPVSGAPDRCVIQTASRLGAIRLTITHMASRLR